jgi:lipopolysaccharide transport system permease protein
MSEFKNLPVTLIRPPSGRRLPNVGELWRNRDLAYRFAWRDVKVRYKQSLIGVAWAVLQPFLTMVVFTLIFGTFANLPSQGLDYPVFLCSALVPWFFFASSLNGCASSVVSSRILVQKVYFPRLMLPLSAVLVPAVDLIFSSSMLFGVMFWYHAPIRHTVVLAPLFVGLLAVTAIGVGSMLAVANVRYRDVPYAIPLLIQLWLYLSPVLYPSAALPERYDVIYALNPINCAITGFRWAVTGTPQPTNLQFGLGIPMALFLFVAGTAFFHRAEPKFADTI